MRWHGVRGVCDAAGMLCHLIVYDQHPVSPPYQGGEPAHQFPLLSEEGAGGDGRAYL
jgi:hypothetical protein